MFIFILSVIVLGIVGGALIYRNNKKSIDKAEAKAKDIIDVLKK
jgi:uncharacterized protein (UPF0333 family)